MYQQRRRTSWAGPAVGVLLFAAGLSQARRLASGDAHDAQRAARTSGITRMAVGGMIAARPELFVKLLHGTASRDAATRLLVRIFAVREIAVGLGTLMAATANRDVRRWLLLLSVIDTGEALVLLPAVWRRTVPAATGIAFIAADLGSSVSGIGVVTQIIRHAEDGAPATKAPNP